MSASMGINISHNHEVLINNVLTIQNTKHSVATAIRTIYLKSDTKRRQS